MLGVRAERPTDPQDFALVLDWQAESMGQRPFDWPRPDGFPDVAEAWTSASRLLRSWKAHWSLAGGWWPTTGVRYRHHAAWLPPLPQTYGQVVDHLSRRLLARPATRLLKSAARSRTASPTWTCPGSSPASVPSRSGPWALPDPDATAGVGQAPIVGPRIVVGGPPCPAHQVRCPASGWWT